MGLGTFVLCDNLSRGDEEGCPCTGKRSVGRNSIQGPPIRTRRTRVLPSDSTSPSPSAPLPRGQSPGRAVPRQPVLPASTTRPSGPSLSGSPACLRAARGPERSPSLSVTAVCAFFLLFFLLLFSFPLLPLSRLVTGLQPIAVSPAGAG